MVAGLALTACQSSSGATGAASSSATPTETAAGTISSASAGASTEPTLPPATGAGAAAGSGSGGGSTDCRAANLKASFGTTASDQTTIPVNLQNTGPTCVMDGFPGVDASGKAGKEPIAIPVSRDTTSYQKVTLATNQTAQFVISYSQAGTDPGTQFVPSFFTITPPNTTSSLTLKVPSGVYYYMDYSANGSGPSGTDQLPGTTISPVTTGPTDAG